MGDVFFVVSKAAGIALRPDTLLLALAAIGLLLRAPRLVALSLALTALIGLVPLHSLVVRPLERWYPPEPPLGAVAGILLLGGGEDIEPGLRIGLPQIGPAGDRYLATLALARRYPDAPVLFAGGGAELRPDGSESRMSARLLTEAGLAPERLILEDRSRNTAENAAFSLPLRPDRPGAWVLVTSAAHMPRAVGSFCAAGWQGIVPWPTDYRAQALRFTWNPAGHLADLHQATREWIGLVGYRATGRLDALFPEGCPQ